MLKQYYNEKMERFAMKSSNTPENTIYTYFYRLNKRTGQWIFKFKNVDSIENIARLLKLKQLV